MASIASIAGLESPMALGAVGDKSISTSLSKRDPLGPKCFSSHFFYFMCDTEARGTYMGLINALMSGFGQISVLQANHFFENVVVFFFRGEYSYTHTWDLGPSPANSA